MKVVKEEWVHAAVDYMMHDGEKAAAAKGELVRTDFQRKKVRGQLILSSPHKSNDLRVAYAESHPDYVALCEKLAACEAEVEKHKHSRNRAETICSMWQTEQATLRGLRAA